MALGTAEVTLKDLTGAFNKIANGGVKQEFRTVLSIKDSHGEIVFEVDPKERNDEGPGHVSPRRVYFNAFDDRHV